MGKKIVIIGGVAGGASAAARARRISEDAEIIMLERGPFVSFANCGLPYHMGGIIKDREDLLVQTPESLKGRFNLDVRIHHEALSIQRDTKEVRVKNLKAGTEFSLPYDVLILSPGAEPFKPPIPGLNLPNVFTMKTIPDLDAVMGYLEKNPVRHATVIGGGFIGLEVAENFRHRGLAVTLVEKDKQVMPPMDAEMVSLLHQHLRFHGVDLRLGSQVAGISHPGSRTSISFTEGSPLETDLIVLSIGVRPEVKLAKEAGLRLGERGGIVVDAAMRTSDPSILAVGDAIETLDPVTGVNLLVPLAGPANRQGRMAADTALSSQLPAYRGTQGTWICKVFDLAAAMTGASEKWLKRQGKAFQKVYIHPASHAGYYPGAAPMAFKLLYEPGTGKILGAQIVGADGADKRIDVIATAMAGKMTVSDLTHLELAYAPPYGSAKDPVNLAGMVAENILNGTHQPIQADELNALPTGSFTLLDTRTLPEHEAGHIPGSLHIPVNELRDRLGELPKDREIIVYCQVGLRGYVANRMLVQKGFPCRNLIGGYKTWSMFHEEKLESFAPLKPLTEVFCSSPSLSPAPAGDTFELDACGLQCPGPLMKMRARMEELKAGQMLRITATDPGFPNDAVAWCKRSGNRLVKTNPENGRYVAVIEKTAAGLSPAVSCPTGLPAGREKNKLTMVVFSNDLDRAYATFIIANGAASMGMEVTLFFTFWGLNILRRKDAPAVEKTTLESMFGMMMPKGPDSLGLSQMHYGGVGTAMMRHVMSSKNVAPLPELIAAAKASGVQLVACTMSMDVMGIKKSELIDGVQEGGVAAYIDSAANSGINLFV
jgi:NADPH-dependent 2,4-dienoyl-CoA reductase/sulfur reductase-like enzyme/peroxiredoxin family protein/TusA-related sulfurtransferase/rhodanese-related sulfurtransferase